MDISKIPNIYDTVMLKYNKQHKLPFDWRWTKAQMFRESSMNPDAVSTSNAKGLLQLKDMAAFDVHQRYGLPMGDLLDPEYNIQAGILYMKWLYDTIEGGMKLDKKRDLYIELALAAYYSGIGTLKKAAFRLSGMPSKAQDYVHDIHKLYVALGGQEAS